jgi:hypothetical protein
VDFAARQLVMVVEGDVEFEIDGGVHRPASDFPN